MKRENTIAVAFGLGSRKNRSAAFKRRTKPMTVHGLVSMVVSMFVTVTYFLYLTIARAALDIYNCEPTDPPTGNFICPQSL